jgi:hypothetical protein
MNTSNTLHSLMYVKQNERGALDIQGMQVILKWYLKFENVCQVQR